MGIEGREGHDPTGSTELPTKLWSSFPSRMACMVKGVDCKGTGKFAGNGVLKFNWIRTDVK